MYKGLPLSSPEKEWAEYCFFEANNKIKSRSYKFSRNFSELISWIVSIMSMLKNPYLYVSTYIVCILYYVSLKCYFHPVLTPSSIWEFSGLD